MGFAVNAKREGEIHEKGDVCGFDLIYKQEKGKERRAPKIYQIEIGI